MALPGKVILSFVLSGIAAGIAAGQTEHFAVKKASFCSEVFDEYSPVAWHGGIVFCSNRSQDSFLSYKNKNQKSPFSIFYIKITGDPGWQHSRLLDQILTTSLNDGPASFDTSGNLIFYSRNLRTETGIRNRMDPGNVLGLFSARLSEGEWTDLRPFPYNNTSYSLTTPALDPTGKILVFASDMPGGYGGTDLYISRFNEDRWSVPENLGSRINSTGNEVYPFISGSGSLFFTSDRAGGLGKKDIYLADSSGTGWLNPACLESPINSESDDFGFTCDDRFERGWFSSNRGRTDDIYFFETKYRPFYGCDSIQKNYYCYLFSEGNYSESDSISISYQWSFSDGTSDSGVEVEHCFPGPGKYSVHLKIIQIYLEEEYVTETSYDFELEDHIQAVINSADSGQVNEPLYFDASGYNLPGFTAEKYYWDFGDGSLETGPQVKHVFSKAGSYRVQLGLTGTDKSGSWQENCVFKYIWIKDALETNDIAEAGSLQRHL